MDSPYGRGVHCLPAPVMSRSVLVDETAREGFMTTEFLLEALSLGK